MVCPLPPRGGLAQQLEDARVAFVGTVTSTSDDGLSAQVHVESTWLGPRLPEVVAVDGGSGGNDEIDRMFEANGRYLFVPNDASPPFQDDECTPTTEYTAAIARLEPDGAIAPQGDGDVGWIGLLIVLGAVGWWQARKARRRAAEIDV